MSGLDKIIEEIRIQAKNEADEILKEADDYCNRYMEDVKSDIEKEAKALEKKLMAERDLYNEKVKSGAQFRERNAILKAKQQCIDNVISKAKEKICNLETSEYFEFLEKLFMANAENGQGKIFFSQKDLDRMPAGFKDKLTQIAENNGGSLEVSSESRDINDGFVLAYGDIEENCTVRALFDADIDRLKDIANKELFG